MVLFILNALRISEKDVTILTHYMYYLINVGYRYVFILLLIIYSSESVSWMESLWWKTAKEILKGKAKGSKLVILGVFLVGVGTTIHISTGEAYYGAPLVMLGAFAFASGLILYNEEARYELEKKRNKDTLKRQ